jgi:hypothetical protein
MSIECANKKLSPFNNREFSTIVRSFFWNSQNSKKKMCFLFLALSYTIDYKFLSITNFNYMYMVQDIYKVKSSIYIYIKIANIT